MSTLHKAEIRQAGPLNSFKYQTSPMTAIHLPGDRLVMGNLPVRPSAGLPVIGLTPTEEEVAAVESITCMEDLRNTEVHRFGAYHSQNYVPPRAFYKQGIERPNRPNAGRRPFTPDSRRMASVLELKGIAEAEEFFQENMEKLEAQWAAGKTDYQRLAEEPELAAAVPSRRRTAAGVVDFGNLVQA